MFYEARHQGFRSGVHSENVRALSGSEWDAERAWSLSLTYFAELLALIDRSRDPYSAALLFVLEDAPTLMIEPPLDGSHAAVSAHPSAPPQLVVEVRTPEPRWRPFETYERPLEWSLEIAGRAPIPGMYSSFRSLQDVRDAEPHSRQLIFAWSPLG